MKLLINMWRKEKNKLLLMSAMVMTFLILINCMAGTLTIGSNVLLIKDEKLKHYKLFDNYVGEIEKELFQSQESLQKLKNFYSWLNTYELFNYQCINRQFVQLEKENANVLTSDKSIQVNSSFFDYNTVKFESGEIYSNNDYVMESLNDIVPVIVGKEFSDVFDIGDEVSVQYMGQKFKGQIKGILSSGSSFMLRNEIQMLDKYIILPSMEFIESPVTKEEWSFQMKLYLDKTAGIIITDIPVRELSNLIQEVCMNLNLEPYGIEGNSSYNFNIWGSMGEELRNTYYMFFLFVLIISMLSYTIECQNHVLQLKRKYSIANANGFSKLLIILSSGLCICLDIFMPMMISIIIDIIVFGNYTIYPYVLVYTFILFVVSFIVCFFTMNNENYWLDIRGRKYGNNTN